MTNAEIQTHLDEVDAAILAVLQNQTYSIDTGHGRQSVTRASLKQLRAYRAELERRLSRANNPYVYSAEVRR